jgi:hypothetical protein
MRYELLGHRVRVYGVGIALLGILVSAAVWLRTEVTPSTTAAVVMMVKDGTQTIGNGGIDE